MIGQVHAAGLTVEQLQANLVTAYKKYFKDPQVTVQVTDSAASRCPCRQRQHPRRGAIAGKSQPDGSDRQAGGLRADAGDSVLITRNLSEGPIPVAGAFTDPTGKYSVAHIDVRAIMSGKDPQGNILIKPHDVITVPRARMIYVLGNVGRPGGYVLTENETMSITQAIALAGGWGTTAKLGGTKILRADGGAEREEIPATSRRSWKTKRLICSCGPTTSFMFPTVLARRSANAGWKQPSELGSGASGRLPLEAC